MLGGLAEIDAVGHRIVHGAKISTVQCGSHGTVEAAIERYTAFAPLHNADNLKGIRAPRELLEDHAPQIAVFDTAFHRTLHTGFVPRVRLQPEIGVGCWLTR